MKKLLPTSPFFLRHVCMFIHFKSYIVFINILIRLLTVAHIDNTKFDSKLCLRPRSHTTYNRLILSRLTYNTCPTTKTVEKVFVSKAIYVGFYGFLTYVNISFKGYRKQSTRLSLRHLAARKVSTLRLLSCHSCLRHLVHFTHGRGAVQISYKLLSNCRYDYFFDSFRAWATVRFDLRRLKMSLVWTGS